jgi:hypothetical protein
VSSLFGRLSSTLRRHSPFRSRRRKAAGRTCTGAPNVERSAGIGQVSQAVTQLGGATRQSAALANRSAEAPASRREQADRLVHSVGALRLSRACPRWPAVVACPSRPHNRRTVRTRTNHSLKVAST